MAPRENLTLDGLALNDGVTFDMLALSAPPPKKRTEWITGADADGAALVRDPLFEPRTITATLRVVPQASTDTALDKLRLITDKLEEAERHPNGLALTWTPADSTESYTAYVLSGEITDLPITVDSGWFQKAPSLTIELTCKPHLYGAEVTVAASSSALPAMTYTVASVTGDVPAEARLIVTDNATQSRRHVEWGLEQRHYNASTSLLIDSDSLVVTGFAGTQTTRTGAYDPDATGNNVIRGTLTTTPVAICGTGNLSHVGTYRVKARIYTTASSSDPALGPRLRLAWREGDGSLQRNSYVYPPSGRDRFAEVDLGLVSIPEKLLGTQRWSGQIEAYSTTAGDTADIDYLVLIPAGEGYGKGRSPTRFETVTSFSARDEFDQTAGALGGKTAPVGGAWVTSGGTTDFSVETTGKTAQRSVATDANNATGGRYAVSGVVAFAAQLVQVDIKTSALPTGSRLELGVLARYTDASNYLSAIIGSGASGTYLSLMKVTGGGQEQLGWTTIPVSFSVNAWHTIRLVVDTRGLIDVWFFPQGGNPGTPVASMADSALATGGTLASGKPGIYDQLSSQTATRNYDNFVAAVPTVDAVAHSGQSAEFRHDSAIREDSTGTYWGPIPLYRGSRFLLPPAGDESRTSRLLVKARRNDIDVGADDNIADSTTAQVLYTPRYLTPR